MVKSGQQRQTKVTAAKKSKSTPQPRTQPRRSSGTRHKSTAAGVARDLTKLEANPASQADLARVQRDIEQHGLQTFFQAMAQTPAGKRMAKERVRERARQKVQEKARKAHPSVAVVSAPEEGEVVKFLGAPSGDAGQLRQSWRNCIGSVITQPLRLYRPTTLAELRSVIQQAAAHGCRVKAAGAGHSFTDVATTTDFLVDTQGLNHPLPLETDVLKDGTETDTLFETEAGIVVRDLNEALWDAGLGLINMGGYDGQTIMGVISTSTHGSGIAIGPLSGFAQSLTFVVAGGRVLRIEPKDGMTDPARWAAKHPDIELVQDDDCFHACQVSIGCMGVVYSLVLQVCERYWMKEERTLSTWRQVKQDLQDGRVLAENRHYEVLVNPYLTNGEHTCLITRRNPVQEPTVPPKQLPHRNYLVELFAKFPGSGQLLLNLINTVPDLVPTIIDTAMQGLVADYVDRSYRVFNIGAANDVPAYGSEIGFPLVTHLDAVERILQIAADGQRAGKAYLTSPFSLRFVKASPAFMSMMHGTDTCMVEFPMLDNTIGGKELLRRIEGEMYALGGRPHWGLLNFISGGNGLLESMYPRYDTWLAVYRQLNPDGTFDNAFTERCGISTHAFVRN